MRELKPKRRIAGLRWLLRGGVLLALAVSAARYAWGVYGDRVWSREIARYPEASALVAPPDKVPPENDAATDLVAAAKQIDADPRGNWILNDTDSVAPLDEEQLVLAAGLLRRLDGVWAKLDAADRKTGANWHVEGDFDRSLSKVNSITPFLRVAAQYFHQTGDDRRALACVRRILRLGKIAESVPDGYFDSIRQIQAASRTVLRIASGLRIGSEEGAVREDEVHGWIGVLLDESRARPALLRQLEYQRAVLIDESRACADGGYPNTTRLPVVIHEPWKRRLIRPMIQTDTSLMLAQADQVIAAARVADDVPTALSLAPEAGELRVLREDNPYLHLWAVTCWPRYEQYVRQHFETLAEGRMAATALALRGYSRQRGDELPARLDALVPEWLPGVPGDPMAHARPLTYRPGGGADPLLYSVGRDGIDDGGSEEPPRKDWTIDDGDWSHIWWKRDAVVHLRGVTAAAKDQ